MEWLPTNDIITDSYAGDAMSEQDQHVESDPLIDAYSRDVDRTLIRENLRLSVEERFEKLMQLQRFAEELRRAGRERDSPR